MEQLFTAIDALLNDNDTTLIDALIITWDEPTPDIIREVDLLLADTPLLSPLLEQPEWEPEPLIFQPFS